MREILPGKYNKKLLSKLLFGIMILMVVGFATAILLFGYELTSWDVPGGMITSLLLAHLLYLLVAEEEDLE